MAAVRLQGYVAGATVPVHDDRVQRDQDKQLQGELNEFPASCLDLGNLQRHKGDSPDNLARDPFRLVCCKVSSSLARHSIQG